MNQSSKLYLYVSSTYRGLAEVAGNKMEIHNPRIVCRHAISFLLSMIDIHSLELGKVEKKTFESKMKRILF